MPHSWITGTWPIVVSYDSTGMHVALNLPLKFYAQITGSSGAAYSWKEMYIGATGVMTAVPGGRTGSTTANPAYELNLMTGVPTNTIVEMIEAPYSDNANGTLFSFGYPASGGASGIVVVDELILQVQPTININTTPVNNVNLPLTSGVKVPLNVTSAATLSGIVAPSPAASVVLYLQNIGTAALTLSNLGAGSSAANQFHTPNGEDFTLSPAGSGSCCEAMIEYVPSDSKWWFPGPVPGGPRNSVVVNSPVEGGLYGGGTWFSVDPVNSRLMINQPSPVLPSALTVTPLVVTDVAFSLVTLVTQTGDIIRSVFGTNTTIKHTPVTGGARTSLNHSTVDTAALSVYSVSDTDEVYKGVAHSSTATANLLDLSVPSGTSYTMDPVGNYTIQTVGSNTSTFACFTSSGANCSLLMGQDASNCCQFGGNSNSGFAQIIVGGVVPGGGFDFCATQINFDLIAFARNNFVFRVDNSQQELYGADFTTGTSNNTPQAYVKTGWNVASNAGHIGYIVIGAVDFQAGSDYGGFSDRDGILVTSDGVSVPKIGFFTKATVGSAVVQQNGDVAAGLKALGLFNTANYSGGTGTKPLYYVEANSNTVTNTTVETTFTGVSYTVPANTLDTTVNWIKVSLKGRWTGNTTTDNVDIRVKLGGVTVLDTGTHIFGANTSVAGDLPWSIEGRIVPTATNTVDGRGTTSWGTLTGSGSNLCVKQFACDVANVGVNFSAGLAVTVTAQWSSASVNDTVELDTVFLEFFHT